MKTRLGALATGAALGLLVPSAAQAALVADWKMDEAGGASVMVDSAGGDNKGTITSVQTGVAGIAGGKAYSFDGATSYVQVADANNLDPGNASITVGATVKVANAPMVDDSYDVLRKGLVTTKGGDWKMEIKRSSADATVGRLHCVFKGVLPSGGSSLTGVQASVDVVDGTAHTLRCKKTSSQVIAVVDGRSFTAGKTAGSIANDQPVIIGTKEPGDDHFEGIIDHVVIYIG